jgi:outer membrane receptor protein involved in Fe transport
MRLAATATLLALAAPAAAAPVEIEIPTLVLEEGPEEVTSATDDLDLANVVLTAARGVTTVQEAPAIVTVITRDEIRDRGYAMLIDAIDAIPGWYRGDGGFGQFPYLAPRGTIQTILYLRDGMSLMDPLGNVSILNQLAPVENIERVEVVTGPGGVLWGANSYVGVINVVTKRAADVDGVEAEVALGDGPGDRAMARAWVMGGLEELWHDDLSLFLHAAVQSYEGPEYTAPQPQFGVPPPLANAPFIYGPLERSDQGRSTMVMLDGTLQFRDLEVQFAVPFVERTMPMGFAGTIAREGTENQADWKDSYVSADYRTRAGDDLSLGVKTYAIRFDRGYQSLPILPPSALLSDGLRIELAGNHGYRVGGALHADWKLVPTLQLLAGAEAFREWVPDGTQQSRQGPGVEVHVLAPADHSRIPLPCPLEPDPTAPGQARYVAGCPLTFMFETSRTVAGAYVNPRWRLHERFALDAGARVQAAPDALSDSGYAPIALVSGAAVVQLARDYHAKLGYTEGFRPPVFNNTDSNGESIQLDGARDLETESSRAVQAELNGRVLRGRRRVRELGFRVDYSYTRLEDLIQIVQGRYVNSAPRDIHSAELLAKLYLSGGHRFELSYTWMRMRQEDRGIARHLPEHFARAGGVFRLREDIQASAMLGVMGSYDDPNLMIEHRDLAAGETVSVLNSEMVVDRLPPTAELTAGVTYTGVDRLRVSAYAYNAFAQRAYYMDTFGDTEPRLEFVPNPRPGFRAVVSASYSY